ncbi:MAG: ribosome silencing factor [Eubacteriales bacterium]
MEIKEQAIAIAKALDEKKAGDVKVIRVEEITTLAEYFVIASASSNTQIKALSESCEKAMDEIGEPVHHIEGHRGGTWVLMDFSAVVVHIFMEEAREFYDLERLWKDGEEIDLSEILLP